MFFPDEELSAPYAQAMLAGLRELGYSPGRDLIVDIRYANGDSSRVPALVDELIALKPDVLFGISELARVMMQKTKAIPIVLTASTDPVAGGFAQSLARPGGNVTGLTGLYEELIAKHVELLVEIVPTLSRLVFFSNPPPLALAVTRLEQAARAAATAKHLSLIVAGAQDPEGVEKAFAMLEAQRAQGILVVATGNTLALRREIVARVRRLRLPSVSAMGGGGLWAEIGGLASYGVNLIESYRTAAGYVDRILKGGDPAVMPIEQAKTIDLVINLKAARELGVKVPQSVLLRANRVIE